MLILTVMALILATIPLFGGRLRRLARVELVGTPLLAMALVAQITVISVFPGASERVSAVVHLATYGLAAVFVYRNRHVPGLLVIAGGGALNAFCIALNGGTLPARAAALEKAGIAATPGEFVNSGVLEDPKLWWLGDVFYVPGWLPVSNVFSIGDVVIVAGAAYGLHCLAQSRLTHVQLVTRYDLPPLDDTELLAAAELLDAEPFDDAADLLDASGSDRVAPEPLIEPFLAAAAAATAEQTAATAEQTAATADRAPASVPAPRPPLVAVTTVAASVTATSPVAWHDPALVAAVAADAGLVTD